MIASPPDQIGQVLHHDPHASLQPKKRGQFFFDEHGPEHLVTHHANTSKQDGVIWMDLDCLAVVVLSKTDLAHPQITCPQAIPDEKGER